MPQHRALTVAILFALLPLSIAARGPQEVTEDASRRVCEAGFRLFDHELPATNPVCIPESPERIASLSTSISETAIALGRTPVVVQNKPGVLARHPDLEGLLSDTADAGWPGDIEVALAAHPDVIIGIAGDFSETYGQLSAIAPTILLETSAGGSGLWQDYDNATARTLFDNPIQYTVSEENLRDADGDVIIAWIFGSTSETLADAEARLNGLPEDPLWRRLEAVRNDRVYVGGPHRIGSGIFAAHRILDDLFAFVAGVDPATVAPNPLLRTLSRK